MPAGILKITGLPLETNLIECENKITDPSINTLLTSSLKTKKSKKKVEGEKATGATVEGSGDQVKQAAPDAVKSAEKTGKEAPKTALKDKSAGSKGDKQ
uniref:Uncharacterized protein n=1 Tax=Syphacia muris TaxID=451379 RepID=A0A0N5AUM7_9BILA